LRELYWLHYQPAGPLIALWDEWMPMSTLWPARGEGPQLDAMRARWAGALAGRPSMRRVMSARSSTMDGPCRGLALPPLGAGWRDRLHFASTGVPGYDAPHAAPDGWKLTAARGEALSVKGCRSP